MTHWFSVEKTDFDREENHVLIPFAAKPITGPLKFITTAEIATAGPIISEFLGFLNIGEVIRYCVLTSGDRVSRDMLKHYNEDHGEY